MGCKYACSCGGFCPGCTSYERENYFGEAEDMRSQQLGYRSYEDHMEYMNQKQTEPEYEEQPDNDDNNTPQN